MKLFELFTSRHTRWLEDEIKQERIQHAAEIESLKKVHAEQVSYAITECERLRSEIGRLRLYLEPSLEAEQPGQSKEKSGAEPPPIGGTPWMRVLAREIRAQEENWQARHLKPAEEEKLDGGSSEGRTEIPLSEPSQPA